ncbi:MAG: lysophospholipid acyltransferase family protein, partial [Flavobacteriaceae bacterium]|nr:lysophospholipid acyltransferase family protein [Flavobacteriaceae bacterium]
MGLVNAKEVAQTINLDKFGFLGTTFGWALMKILNLNTLNKIYDKNKHLKEIDFINALINDFEIKFEIPEEDLKRIPKTGPFITISNHPLGGVDGILLLKLLLDHRPDFKILANFLLHRIEPMKSYVMPVNPFEGKKELQSNLGGFKASLEHLKDGHPLGVFPAGEVSTYRDGKLIVDKPWQEAAMKLIQRAKVPIVPIYFHAKNSKLFYRMAKMSDTLRTAKLPSEVLTQKQRLIRVRIGNPISINAQDEYKTLEDFTNFLRTKTYLLANPFEKKKLIDSLPKKLKFPKPTKNIVNPVSVSTIEKEIYSLQKNDKRLLQSKNYEVYLAEASSIPNIIQEIGRLREITFREVGEGTNKAIDLDKFDAYYHHMFLWDKDEKMIAGAYRMGLGSQIYSKYGIDGFYLQELFRFDQELFPMMSKSIEMGRAFIIKRYQMRPMPLFLLWKGIVHSTLRYPEHKYLIGGVSISNKFSEFSKSLMIEFMKSNYYDPYIA